MIQILTNLVFQALDFLERVTGVSFAFAPPSPVAQQTQRKTFSASVVRADDLLVLTLDFYNLRLDAAKRLLPDGAGDSFIIARFPPQSIAEQAFAEPAFPGDDPGDPLWGPPVAARAAGESRLVFHLDPALLPLEFSLEPLLAALSQSAPLVRDRIGEPPPMPPDGGVARFGRLRSQFSAIEAPWRLIISPHSEGRWAHSAQPVKDSGKIELWHTRLGVRLAIGSGVDERST